VPGARLAIYGPRQESGSLCDAVSAFMCPPYFPVTLEALAGEVTLDEVPDGSTDLRGWTITAHEVPHVGTTMGFRIEADGVSVAYVPDHQQPGCGSTTVADAVLELCDGVDLLIHDAQFTDTEFIHKHDWGHCTPDYAVEVARQSGARRLALFHHDPSRDDDALDALAATMARRSGQVGLDEILVAAERQQVSLRAVPTR